MNSVAIPKKETDVTIFQFEPGDLDHRAPALRIGDIFPGYRKL